MRTMYPRRVILPNNDILVHVTSRCHDRNHFLEPVAVKNKILKTWAKFKRRYGIRIYGFIIMDNHYHAIMRAPNAEMLGNFMRTTNSQLARFVNFYFERDSQALRERYKSPLISNFKYFCDSMKYIFSNRLRVNQNLRPENDPFCSASWNLKPRKIIENPTTKEEEEHNQLALLLDDISELGHFDRNHSSNFIEELTRMAFEQCRQLLKDLFEHSHTICDAISMKFRIELLKAYQRERGPPAYYMGGAYWCNNP